MLLVTHDLEEALSLSDVVYLLSQGPRARITQEYNVPIPRPRDPVRSRLHPSFAPLYEKLWTDLSREVGGDECAVRPRRRSGGGVMTLNPRYAWVRQLATLAVVLALWEAAGYAGWLNPLFAPPPSKIGSALYESVRRRPHLAASGGDLHRGARRPDSRASSSASRSACSPRSSPSSPNCSSR